MKKNIFIPLAILALMAAFAFVCFFVFITRGRDSWLKRKLRLGAIILSFLGMAVGCIAPECYDMPSATMYPCNITDSQKIVYNYQIEFDPSVTNILYCSLQYGYYSNDFSYQLLDSNNQLIASNELELVTFPDPGMESRYAVPIDSTIPDGTYSLKFYHHNTNYPADANWPFSELSIHINR